LRHIHWRDTIHAVQSWPRWKRYVLIATLSPALLIGLLSLGFYANLHLVAHAKSNVALPVLPVPTDSQRLLIVAPHCDDETLGAGGLIAQARKKGTPVHVVFLTNGDAFPAACAIIARRVPPQAHDYVHLGELRQKEALAALRQLGVEQKEVTFLGYPDQGLRALWETNWLPNKPFRSRFTQRSSTPRGPYCGQNVQKDLTAVLEAFKPTDVYVTHPADDHADHSMAAAFTEAALTSASPSILAVRPAVHYYIVHRGDWPLPQGYSPQDPLLPPAGFSKADTHWQTFPLATEAQKAKARALNQYSSQLELCGRQLRSFLRENEIFGQLSIPQIPDSHHLQAKALDAQGDDVVRFANPGTDITQLSAAQDGEQLKVTMELRGTTNPGIRYGIRARSSAGAFVARTLHSPTLPPPSSHTLSCTIPLSQLGIDQHKASTVWLSADTGMTSRYIVDQTGYREFQLRSTP
jgi:LmbE family N-acetylglucosaminyl deacetylase